jgi:predicted SnoaL-like aldol condensation-catalyzing enzyme
MIKDEKKVKRAMKRVTSQSGKQHEKSASVNKDASVEYSEYMREVEPSSPVSVRKPKQDDSVNPKKRPRTSGGSRTSGGRKTRKTRK